MSNKAKFYVYEHIRPDTGEVFYVGKGTRLRLKSVGRENPHHKNVVAKLDKLGLRTGGYVFEYLKNIENPIFAKEGF